MNADPTPSAPRCTIPTALYGVIGWPLAQSLSPLLHNTAFQTLGIPASYMLWEIAPERLADFVASVRLLRIAGCSVTIPHKMALLPLLDSVSEQVRLTGAANTIHWQDGKLCGENTDVTGFLAPLADYPLEEATALILGAGGAAHAVAAGLHLRRCRSVHVATPSNTRHRDLASRFGFTPVSWEERHSVPAQVVINTTPLGMHGKHEEETPYDFALAPKTTDGLAYDIVYNPLRTRFLAGAEAAGWRTVSGLEMFHWQGNAQFRLWTGHDLPPASRAALETALGVHRP